MRMTLHTSMQICREAAGQLKAQGLLLKAMTPTVPTDVKANRLHSFFHSSTIRSTPAMTKVSIISVSSRSFFSTLPDRP